MMTADIPNAFVQTDIDKKEIGERIIMKIRGPLVDMVLELSPETYASFVAYEKQVNVLHVVMGKALYGTPSVRKKKPHANLLKARSRVSFGSFFVGLGMFVRGGTASVMAVNIT